MERWGFLRNAGERICALQGDAGYTMYSPDSSGAIGNASNFSGMYAQFALTHRVNQYVDYSLSGGRSITFALFGGTIDLYSASWQANWRVLREISLATSFNYNHGSQVMFRRRDV